MLQEAAVTSRPAEPDRRAIEAHAALTRALATMRDVDDVLRVVAAKLCELLSASRCSVYLKDQATGIFRGRVGHASTDIDGRVRQLVAGVEADRFTREILETGKPVLVTDARLDARPVRSTMRSWGVRAMLGLPLTCDDEVVALAFVDEEDGTVRFGEEAQEAAAVFAQLAAGVVGQALATMGTRADLRAATRQNEILRRAAALDERLTRLAVQGGGVDEVLAVVAERTGKPVAALDAGEALIGLAPGSGAGCDLRAALTRWSHPAVRAALAELDGDAPAVAGPFPEAGLSHRYLIGAVMARDERFGRVVMAETSPLSALDRHAVRRAAAMIALELSARRRVVAAERDSHAALVSDLIRGDRDPGWLAQRGRELDVDLAAPHIVCLLAGPDGGPPPDPGAVAVALAGHLGGAPAPGAALADATAVLLPVPEAASRAATAFARGAVADALAGLPGVVAALSDPVTRPEDVPHAYDEAVQVLACLRAHAGGPARVLAVHDLGAARLLLASLDREHADRFADHKLGPLLAHGSSEELLETLETFFACGRGIRTAAAALGVHENTIRYRLGKVADLCALDVIGDADDQTTALLALRVLQLAGRRPWPAPATAGAA